MPTLLKNMTDTDIFLGAPVYTPEELGATVDEDGAFIELPVQVTKTSNEIWRSWKSPIDAVLWGSEQLPRMPLDQIQAEFDALPAINGKKAPTWVKRVLELWEEF